MLKILYYWINFYLTKNKKNDDPSFNALMILILLEGSNLISLGKIIFIKFSQKIDIDTAYLYGIIFAVVMISSNFFFISKKRSHLQGHFPIQRKQT